jgi:hypothetical protein
LSVTVISMKLIASHCHFEDGMALRANPKGRN